MIHPIVEVVYLQKISVVKLSCCIQCHLCFKHLGASVKACDVEDNDGVTLDKVSIFAARIVSFICQLFLSPL